MRFEDKIHQGVHCLLDSGHMEVAQWMLDKLLADYPNHAEAHHEKGILAHSQGDTRAAGSHFFRAADLVPDNPVYLKSLADYYHVCQADAAKALTQYQKVLAIRPDDAGTLLVAGHLCVSLQRFDEACSYYRRVLDIEPDQHDAAQLLHQLESKQAERADGHTTMAAGNAGNETHAGNPVYGELAAELKQHPDSARAHNDLGVVCYEQGEKEKALGHYEQAVALDPENAVFRKNLADFLWNEKGDAKRALEMFVEVLKCDPKDTEALLSCANSSAAKLERG